MESGVSRTSTQRTDQMRAPNQRNEAERPARLTPRFLAKLGTRLANHRCCRLRRHHSTHVKVKHTHPWRCVHDPCVWKIKRPPLASLVGGAHRRIGDTGAPGANDVRGNHPSRRAKEPRWNKQQHVFSARRWPPPVSAREAEVGPRGGRLGREGLSPLPRNGWRPPPLTDSSGGAERRLHAGAPVNAARVSVNARADVHAPVAGRRPINELAWTHPAEAGGRVVQIRPPTTRRHHRMQM
jgi:hypothetical protein